MSRTFLLFPQIILVSIVALVGSGCVTSTPEERWQPVVRHSVNRVHIVKWQDETLSAIANWYTGSSDNMDALAHANPTLDPTRMVHGDQIFIPQNLLKTRGDMSREFLDAFLSASVETPKINSTVTVKKTLRIIIPTPYKKKKGEEDLPQQEFSSEENELAETPQPMPEAAPASIPVEGVDSQLFGPK